jgi:hypothetical protein
MKTLIVLCCFSTLLFAAEEGERKSITQPAPKVLQPLVIPPAAVEYEPGSYRYTDPQGKKWIYRKTPFGVARLEDKPAAGTPKSLQNVDDVKVTDMGDSIRFERPGPFGMYKWQTRKSELNEMEKAVWDRQQPRDAAKQD